MASGSLLKFLKSVVDIDTGNGKSSSSDMLSVIEVSASFDMMNDWLGGLSYAVQV